MRYCSRESVHMIWAGALVLIVALCVVGFGYFGSHMAANSDKVQIARLTACNSLPIVDRSICLTKQDDDFTTGLANCQTDSDNYDGDTASSYGQCVANIRRAFPNG